MRHFDVQSVDVRLDVSACRERGMIDWSMTFPDGSVLPRKLSRRA